MVKHVNCETCEGLGHVRTMVPGSTGQPVSGNIECPDCDGTGWLGELDALERLVGPRAANALSAPGRLVSRARSAAKKTWRERKYDEIGHLTYVHREVMSDDPRLTSVVESEIKANLAKAPLPLYWRLTLIRWRTLNKVRRTIGLPPLPRPWAEVLELEARMDPESNLIALIGTRRRIEVGHAK